MRIYAITLSVQARYICIIDNIYCAEMSYACANRTFYCAEDTHPILYNISVMWHPTNNCMSS